MRRFTLCCGLAMLFSTCMNWQARAADEVDTSPLAVRIAPAYPNMKWNGWSPVTENGLPEPLRPIVLTPAGDGSNRIYLVEQRGKIYVFDNSAKSTTSKVFLDWRKKARYFDKENEQGLLGLAFHPKFKENGQFFINYNPVDAKNTTIVSRMKVKGNNPEEADPDSEEILLTVPAPFWNHKGGGLAFGPDGMLYISMGDGGSGGDPFKNGQKLDTLLGKILRIDVDRKEGKLNYAVPKDNPFAGKTGARGEIYAYGLRNVWGMTFDKQTGKLWAADVGQDIWEEINIIVSGGNYGWNVREGLHKFDKGPPQASDAKFIDPIWEYNHKVGKSITGGFVYRGRKVPELKGAYVYCDYVSPKMWALWYDEKTGKVTANREIANTVTSIISFGQDAEGELYFTAVSASGKDIYKFESGK